MAEGDFPFADEPPFRGVPADALHNLATTRGPWTLPDEHETAFRRDMQFGPGYREWYRSFNQRFGGPPDLNDPQYNYRLAWAHGVEPTPYTENDGTVFPHWPSGLEPQPPWQNGPSLKAEDHPTRWMEEFMQRYGVDPNEAPPETLVQSLREGVQPWPTTEQLSRTPTIDRYAQDTEFPFAQENP